MKTRTLSFCILAALTAACTPPKATERSILVPVWEKVLARDGNGEWDYRVMRGEGGEPADGQARYGQAVDNKGRIYLCDSFNDRLLVFTPDGERLSIISVKGRLGFPTDIWVDEADNLYVLGAAPDSNAPDGNQDAQIILKPTASGWDIIPLDPNACKLAPNARGSESWGRQIVPLGSGGLRVMPVFVEGKSKYQILDKESKSVGFAPSRYRDHKGRFYDLAKQSQLRVFNEAGEFMSQIKVAKSLTKLVPYRGWIYVFATNKLYRYAEDGTVEDEIKSSSEQETLWWPILASPFADHLYTYSILENEKDKVETFTVTKWEYRKAPSESEEGATKEDQ